MRKNRKPLKALNNLDARIDDLENKIDDLSNELVGAFNAEHVQINEKLDLLTSAQELLPCPPDQIVDEFTRKCVDKPWKDWVDCKTEKAQGACPGGTDPNPLIKDLCFHTCAL